MQDVGNPAVARAVQILAQKAGIYGMLGGQVVDVESEGQPLEREKLGFYLRFKNRCTYRSFHADRRSAGRCF